MNSLCNMLLMIVLAIGSCNCLLANETLVEEFRDFATDHCHDCHSGSDAEAGLDLTRLVSPEQGDQQLGRWIQIHDRIANGEMPPPEYSQVSREKRREIVGALDTSLSQTSQQWQQDFGRVRDRRLNRTEYEYVLRDLLHLPNLEVREMLPPDAGRDGFDNVGSALDVSYVQMTRYLDAARTALDAAICLKPEPKIQKHHFLAKENGRFRQVLQKQVEAVPVGDAVGLLRQPNSAQAPFWMSKFQVQDPGVYRVRVKTFGFIWDEGKAIPADRVHAVTYQAVQGTIKRPLVTKDVSPMPEEEKPGEEFVHQFDAFLKVGDELQFWFGTLDDRNKKKVPIDQYVAPGVAIEWIEIEGPIITDWPSASHQVLFGDLPIQKWTPKSGFTRPDPPMTVRGVGKRAIEQRVAEKDFVPYHVVSEDPKADSRRLLAKFADRAFRRPADPERLNEFQALIDRKLEQNACFDEAMRVGYLAVLCSPDFLFLNEPLGKLDEYALATRLALFLWRSMPDDELRNLARDHKLSESLRDQVDRMLADPRSSRFVEDFTGQWLDLRRISVTEPDEQLYPEFDRLLLSSMVAESHAYFAEMLHSDLGIEHIVDSDFAMINESLARLYGIPGVEGNEIRKVSLPEDSLRGGIITQASVLKVTANGTTTSPVTRGAWFLERILGQPSPPPPPGIPAVEPDLRGATTIRQQLELHRNDEGCAMCHRRIDPPGFALECFDVIGGHRDRYRSLGAGEKTGRTFKDDRPVAYRFGPVVDGSGQMPSGDTFANIQEFRERLLDEKEQLARNLVGKLIVYASGEEIQFCDRKLVHRMAQESIVQPFGLRTMIQSIVQSDLFQRK